MFAVLVGPKLNQQKLIDHEKITVQLFSQLLDNAYQTILMRQAEKDLIFSLNNTVLQMNSLIDTGIELQKSSDDQTLLMLALERAVAMTNASGGTVKIQDENEIIFRKEFPSTFLNPNKVQVNKNNAMIEASFIYRDKKYSTTLYHKESRTGLIPFDETDHLLLDALTRQANAAIENDYLQKRALEMEKVKRELEIAAKIQHDLVPESDPHNLFLEISSFFKPADEVGGDYFDYFELDDNKLGIVIADVTGHGPPAALVMTMMKGILHSITHKFHSAEEALEEINVIVSGIIPADIFVTMQFLVFDPSDHSLSIANAGHNPVLYYASDDKKCRLINIRGCALNLLADFKYTSEKINLKSGDFFLIYTDGINEAHNKNEEMFQISGIVNAVEKNGHGSAMQMIGHVRQELNEFTADLPQADDMIIIAVKVK